ncbi:MAG: hypothetical protein IJN63_07445 [Clostridia bacterium]|nr:hypothetical protein [Clostridia bacterium]
MKKSIYSLVLSDAVIEGIDRMAYGMGISRSALINKILAETVSYTTPEQRMEEVFRSLESLIRQSGSYRITAQPSTTMFSLTAPLTYKYNPTVKYSLELYRDHGNGGEAGVLRISLRSKSDALMELLAAFYMLWSSLEKRATGKHGILTEDCRYVKPIYPASEMSPKEFGQGIADYIRAIDRAMAIFFSRLDTPAIATREIEAAYLSYLNSKAKIL